MTRLPIEMIRLKLFSFLDKCEKFTAKNLFLAVIVLQICFLTLGCSSPDPEPGFELNQTGYFKQVKETHLGKRKYRLYTYEYGSKIDPSQFAEVGMASVNGWVEAYFYPVGSKGNPPESWGVSSAIDMIQARYWVRSKYPNFTHIMTRLGSNPQGMVTDCSKMPDLCADIAGKQ